MKTALFALVAVALTAVVCMVEEQGLDDDITSTTDEFEVEEVAQIPDLPEPEAAPESPPADPYAGYTSWCEELQPPPCASDEECTPSKTGADRRCITPFWYEPEEGDKMGLCIPVYLGWSPKEEKLEMDRRRARLRAIIENSCRYPKWAQALVDEWGVVDCGRVPGRSRHMRQCSAKTFCDPDKLYKAHALVVKREADWRKEKVHNLGPDIEAAGTSWLRHCKRGTYAGNEHFGKCYKDGKKWKGLGDEWQRWRSYGYYGQNSSLWVMEIDNKKAPPEILCHEVYSTEAYDRRMRRAWNKFATGLDCKDDTGRRYSRKLLKAKKQKRDGEPDTWPKKTWYTLHRAVSSGSACPFRDTTTVKTRYQYYAARANKIGLDPDEEVTLQMLGEQIPNESLHADVQTLMTELNTRFPVGWTAE